MDPRDLLSASIDGRRDALVALSHGIHGDAEIGFEEYRSSARVAEALAAGGFDVTHGVAGLDTAIVARAGSGPLRIGICAEYDALPGIGHACGHNIIAGAAVGAGLALAEVADDLGIEVVVLGTPAEEGGGGKIVMLEGGAFDGLNAAMMVHPAPVETPQMTCLAVQHFEVRYRGRSAHASAYPQLGINAADALTVAQVGIGLLRQHIRATDRIHGIVTDGGDAPNIVPERTAGTWYVRSSTLTELAELYPRVQRCFEAGALATGATLSFDEPGPAYSEFLTDEALRDAYVVEAEAIGRVFPAPGEETTLAGSTDMANVSLAMPAIHPMIAIEARGAVNHQPEFTAACITASADRAVRDGALAMARTVIAAATAGPLRERLLSRAYEARSTAT
ncbi:MAG TPA: M20 family metallopeptidase [Egicoccus sp.]|nr:M20 family metallopeptidase [Egicoccus sp.]HSK25221.1 M20 family metallopeptidase [Egicoccus sp.]